MLGHQPVASHHLSTALSAIASAAHRPDWTCIEEVDIPISQRALSFSIDQALYDDLIASAPSTRFRALALSTNLPHACDWLNVVPSPTLGLYLRDREFRSCLCYWLGVPLNNNPYKCPECYKQVDIYGDHQVGLSRKFLSACRILS